MNLENIKEMINLSYKLKEDNDIWSICLDIKSLLNIRMSLNTIDIMNTSKVIFKKYEKEILKISKMQPSYNTQSVSSPTVIEVNDFVLEWLTKLLCKKVIEKLATEKIEIDYSQDLSIVINLVKQLLN